jgi:hypothetical protein
MFGILREIPIPTHPIGKERYQMIANQNLPPTLKENMLLTIGIERKILEPIRIR